MDSKENWWEGSYSSLLKYQMEMQYTKSYEKVKGHL